MLTACLHNVKFIALHAPSATTPERLVGLPLTDWIPRLLLVLGLAGGLLAVGHELLQHAPGPPLPDAAVARVGSRLILRDEWLKAVAATASERRTPLTEADRQQILQRLVDEELLVQQGLALGLVEHDQRLRGQLVSEVIYATSSAAATTPDEATLRRFFADNTALFAPPAALRVQAWRLDESGARQPFQPPVPDSLLPPAKLQTYLGPTLTTLALRQSVGVESASVEIDGHQVVLSVLERGAAATPAFEAVHAQVLAEYRRRSDEAAVRALLERLRARKDVTVEGRIEATP